jgi:hypothetical protein
MELGRVLRRGQPPRGRLTAREWPQLDLPNVLWFFGAATAAIASISVIDEVPESNADLWVFLASLGFLVAYALASVLLHFRGLRVAGGVMAAVAVAMVPPTGYGFTQLIDVYPDDPFFEEFADWSGTVFGIGVATTLAALLAFALTRFAFLLALFVAAVLVTVQLLTPSWGTSGDDRALSGVVSGAATVVIGLLVDAAARRREAFWFYVGGYFAVGASIAYYIVDGNVEGGGSGAWIALLIVGAVVLLGAAFLRRSTWAAYGALGVYTAIFHYLDTKEWMRYFLLGVALVSFFAGIAFAVRRRPLPRAAEPPPPTAP